MNNMRLGIRCMVVLAGLAASHGMSAQAPAGAPAGTNGMCKDGSYSTAASKDGACRGHKGVQAWYAPATAKPAKTSTTSAAPGKPAAPAPAPAPSSMASKPAQGAAPAAPTTPAKTTSTTPPAPAAKTSASKAALAQKSAAPGGGPGLVWVNTASNVYHCQGTDFYGKTKAGAYMSEADAKAKGARPDAGKPCTK